MGTVAWGYAAAAAVVALAWLTGLVWATHRNWRLIRAVRLELELRDREVDAGGPVDEREESRDAPRRGPPP